MSPQVEPDYSAFDSEVISLIEALALVPIGSPDFREWFAAVVESRYSDYYLCERWKNEQKEKKCRNEILLGMYHKKRKSVYGSFSCQSEISWPK